jgi:hypothetical protein
VRGEAIRYLDYVRRLQRRTHGSQSTRHLRTEPGRGDFEIVPPDLYATDIMRRSRGKVTLRTNVLSRSLPGTTCRFAPSSALRRSPNANSSCSFVDPKHRHGHAQRPPVWRARIRADDKEQSWSDHRYPLHRSRFSCIGLGLQRGNN